MQLDPKLVQFGTFEVQSLPAIYGHPGNGECFFLGANGVYAKTSRRETETYLRLFETQFGVIWTVVSAEFASFLWATREKHMNFFVAKGSLCARP